MDLDDIMNKISRHAGTRLGRMALLAGAGHHEKQRPAVSSSRFSSSTVPARQRRVTNNEIDTGYSREPVFNIKFSETADEARKEYSLVEEGMLLLGRDREIVETQLTTNLTIPDFYGANSGPFDTGSVADTDDDEWLDLPVVEWTIHEVLKADQIVQMLLRVYDWAKSSPIQTWTPLLAAIGSDINACSLAELRSDIQGTVQVKRVKTVMDPNGGQSFQFCLNSAKFPVLHHLRAKEDERARRVATTSHRDLDSEQASLLKEIMSQEDTILRGLVFNIAKHREDIDRGLSIVARLDTVLAKAAFAVVNSCVIPTVKSNGEIHVCGFRHPLLKSDEAIPIDLRLASSDNKRALIISGPNGGGKTLVMKSVGVAASFVKLGIPVPATPPQADSGSVRIDFFDQIHVSIGDHQSVRDGQSTFMGQLSQYSDLIAHTMQSAPTQSSLILLDELGSGTDQNAGAAIAQAVIEKMLSSAPGIRLVATTHCPRLKTLSFEDPKFDCAAVLLAINSVGWKKTKMPSYVLKYGVIGESCALDAAARCTPTLPDDVLERAAALMIAGNQDSTYLRALSDSMQRQLEITEDARLQAETYLSDTVQCQTALKRVALAYVRHFGLLESRLSQFYTDMKDNPDKLQLLGDVLSEVRTARKVVKSDAEFLREQGLRPVPPDYAFSQGEAVTITADGEWNGEMATVFFPDGLENRLALGRDDVPVRPRLFPRVDDSFNDGDSSAEFLVFKKWQLAIWNYRITEEEKGETVTSISDAKQKLNLVLATLKGIDNKPSATNEDRKQTAAGNESNGQFTSARQRKASRMTKKRKK